MARITSVGIKREVKRKAKVAKIDAPVLPPVIANDAKIMEISLIADTLTGDQLTNQVIQPKLPLFSNWCAVDAAVVGSAHLRTNPPKPCQDAALADAGKRAMIILADGAGSAAVSHIGASAVVASVRRLCWTMEDNLALMLDVADVQEHLVERMAGQIVAHAKGIIEDLAETQLRSQDDFRCTLLVWVVGLHRAMWLKVGDGALVFESKGECHCIGPAGKGEFANQTCFIGPRLESSQWSWGEINASELSGLAAMSDGAAERLVASDGSRVSQAIGKLLRGIAESKVGRREIFSLLAEAEYWKGTSGDDKSLAMVARNVSLNESTVLSDVE